MQLKIFPQNEIDLFRKGLAIVILSYYFSLLTFFSEFFGEEGFINKSYWSESFTLFKLHSSLDLRYLLLLGIFSCSIFLFFGKLSRYGLLFFYLINLSFYNWNPLIIHEPQPLMNLFLLSFFLLPLKEGEEYDKFYKNGLIIFLGVYYFLAGIKKLIDINFINGTALYKIISWSVMAKNFELNLMIVHYLKPFLIVSNYLTLLFEMGFIFFVFTKYRKYLIIFGVLLHILIYITLEVGNFSWVMILWYTLLLDRKTVLELGEILSLNKWKNKYVSKN
jgi:hypothetical protein